MIYMFSVYFSCLVSSINIFFLKPLLSNIMNLCEQEFLQFCPPGCFGWWRMRSGETRTLSVSLSAAVPGGAAAPCEESSSRSIQQRSPPSWRSPAGGEHHRRSVIVMTPAVASSLNNSAGWGGWPPPGWLRPPSVRPAAQSLFVLVSNWADPVWITGSRPHGGAVMWKRTFSIGRTLETETRVKFLILGPRLHAWTVNPLTFQIKVS